ncbi:ribosome-associated heat shock protein Hsp15 [Thiotrichales bacterium 19S3-7]|nr:ribosome-associated heat shock protein Hsp15 [Thiotrichales bacterium 19S3-7]MCF6803038.1 ribosome-associated heat shock protein Hsp15 [Thiotrichales bacterium 19S3-11]
MLNENQLNIRLDKWLWAARFFKTRSLARSAVEGGKVHYNGQRSKPSKIVAINDKLSIRQGSIEKTVIIKALSDKRGPFSEASKLYEETQESIENREQQSAMNKAARTSRAPDKKPNKKQRRQLLDLKNQS